MQLSKALHSGGAIYEETADGFRLLLHVHTDRRGENACYIIIDNVSPRHTAQLLDLLHLDNPENWQELNPETAQRFFHHQDGNLPAQEGEG
jgi:hypothetical protein